MNSIKTLSYRLKTSNKKKLFSWKQLMGLFRKRQYNRVNLTQIENIFFHLDSINLCEAKIEFLSPGGMGIQNTQNSSQDPFKLNQKISGLIIYQSESIPVKARVAFCGEKITGCEFNTESKKLSSFIEEHFPIESAASDFSLNHDSDENEYLFSNSLDERLYFQINQGRVNSLEIFFQHHYYLVSNQKHLYAICENHRSYDEMKKNEILNYSNNLPDDVQHLFLRLLSNLNQLPAETLQLIAKEILRSTALPKN